MSKKFIIAGKIIEFTKYKPEVDIQCDTCILDVHACSKIVTSINDNKNYDCEYLELNKFRLIDDKKEILLDKIIGLPEMKFIDLETKKDVTEKFLKVILKRIQNG